MYLLFYSWDNIKEGRIQTFQCLRPKTCEQSAWKTTKNCTNYQSSFLVICCLFCNWLLIQLVICLIHWFVLQSCMFGSCCLKLYNSNLSTHLWFSQKSVRVKSSDVARPPNVSHCIAFCFTGAAICLGFFELSPLSLLWSCRSSNLAIQISVCALAAYRWRQSICRACG